MPLDMEQVLVYNPCRIPEGMGNKSIFVYWAELSSMAFR